LLLGLFDLTAKLYNTNIPKEIFDKKKPPNPEGLDGKKIWGHRATLPQGFPCSTIADERLDFCVRNGNRYFPLSLDTPKSYFHIKVLISSLPMISEEKTIW